MSAANSGRPEAAGRRQVEAGSGSGSGPGSGSGSGSCGCSSGSGSSVASDGASRGPHQVSSPLILCVKAVDLCPAAAEGFHFGHACCEPSPPSCLELTTVCLSHVWSSPQYVSVVSGVHHSMSQSCLEFTTVCLSRVCSSLQYVSVMSGVHHSMSQSCLEFTTVCPSQLL